MYSLMHVQVMDDAGEDLAMTTAVENDATPIMVADELNVDVSVLVALNKRKFKGLRAESKLIASGGRLG